MWVCCVGLSREFDTRTTSCVCYTLGLLMESNRFFFANMVHVGVQTTNTVCVRLTADFLSRSRPTESIFLWSDLHVLVTARRLNAPIWAKNERSCPYQAKQKKKKNKRTRRENNISPKSKTLLSRFPRTTGPPTTGPPPPPVPSRTMSVDTFFLFFLDGT